MGRTEPLPGNCDVWEIMCIGSTQWRVGFGGAYGLDYTAIIAIAQALGVETDYEFFGKIHILESEILQIVAEKPVPVSDRGCDAAQKKRCTIEFGEHLEWTCNNCTQR